MKSTEGRARLRVFLMQTDNDGYFSFIAIPLGIAR